MRQLDKICPNRKKNYTRHIVKPKIVHRSVCKRTHKSIDYLNIICIWNLKVRSSTGSESKSYHIENYVAVVPNLTFYQKIKNNSHLIAIAVQLFTLRNIKYIII